MKIYKKNLDLKAIKLWCCSMCELKCMSVLYYCSMHNKNNNNYHTQLQVEQHNLISNYYMRNNLLPLGNVCFSKGYVWCMNWVMIIASNRWGKRYTQAFWTYWFMQYKTFILVETKSKYQIGWKTECIQHVVLKV